MSWLSSLPSCVLTWLSSSLQNFSQTCSQEFIQYCGAFQKTLGIVSSERTLTTISAFNLVHRLLTGYLDNPFCSPIQTIARRASRARVHIIGDENTSTTGSGIPAAL